MSSKTLETRNPNDLKRHNANQEIYGDEELELDFVESVRDFGVQEPIVVTKDDIIISGHRRVDAAVKVSLDEVPVLVNSFDSKLEEKEAIVHYNKQRRKTFSQKMREADVLHSVYEAQGRERQGARSDLLQTFAESEYGSTREKTADQLEWSHEKYRQAKKVWDAAKNESEFEREVEKIDAGEQSVHGAYQRLKKWEELNELHDGVDWKRAKDAGVIGSIEHQEDTFRSSKSKVSDSGQWHDSLRTLMEEHKAAWGQPNQGDAYVFTYLLEEDEYIEVSQGQPADLDSLIEKKPSNAILKELYWEKELSLLEIAIKLGVDQSLVKYWMYKEDIPIKKQEYTEPQQNLIDGL